MYKYLQMLLNKCLNLLKTLKSNIQIVPSHTCQRIINQSILLSIILFNKQKFFLLMDSPVHCVLVCLLQFLEGGSFKYILLQKPSLGI